MQNCIGVKQCGNRCTTMVREGTERCGIHLRTLEGYGPNNTRRKELRYVHLKTIREIELAHADNSPQKIEAKQLENERYGILLYVLEESIKLETAARGGIDADEEANRRNAARAVARREEFHRQRVAQLQAEINALPAQNHQIVVAQGLAAFAADPQNVHKVQVIEQVKSTVEKILKVYVPPEYETHTLKTIGEIILECELSKKSAWQMTAKYCEDVDIYDLGIGIYPRVLNSVWQFIKSSPDSVDLKKILASEMKDNIGMCAQGNLSRLCNILSGYIEGIDTRSRSEIIGDKFAEIMKTDISSIAKIETGIRFLRELGVSHEEISVWVSPLAEDEEAENHLDILLAL